MLRKNRSKNSLKKVILSGFLMLITLLGTMLIPTASESAFAVRTNTTDSTTVEAGAEESQETIDTGSRVADNNCKKILGGAGWFVCPVTEGISKGIDMLYGLLERILVINPVPSEDGTPIYEIWKYCRGMTNVVFIIFLLIVIYSQLTGVGITNYGIKRTLPKLIITAMLVNLSFLICSLAVDVSNIVGHSLTGLFDSVAESATAGHPVDGESGVSALGMFAAIGSGAALTIGGAAIAFEFGLLWMLIPTALAGFLAILAGLFTVMLRQAVVPLLIMISPLAMVAYMLPNTEDWFKKWKKLLTQMLVFYPMFSLLFGASHLAGFAIIASAKDGFAVVLGWAVQILPLFLSISLMKMSGTFLSSVNAKLNSLAAGPIAANRAWADSHRQLSKQKHLASEGAKMPSRKLMQFLSNRQVMRSEDTKEYANTAQLRGMKYRASKNWKGANATGAPTRRGERAYERMTQDLEYRRVIERDKNTMNDGLSSLASGSVQRARLDRLDSRMIKASDNLKVEATRGAMIDYRNAEGFQKRMTDAINAHYDQKNEGNENYQMHGVLESAEGAENKARYERIKAIMDGKEENVHFAAADAASTFNAQAQVMRNKFQTYTDLTPATQDVVNRITELTKSRESSSYIDPIIAGIRTLNMRGDTDLVRDQIENILDDGKIKLGTYASQSLANFCMFEVKDSDPFLRRFGKFINLETAAMYNEKAPEKRRKKEDISLDEYISGEYEYIDHYNDDGAPVMKKGYVKKDAATLLSGTSFKGMERTAIANMTEALRKNATIVGEDGKETIDMKKFKDSEEKIWDAIMPNIIGDQFSFLSGSEQIMALSKGLTGVDWGKREFAWDDIFGKEIAKNLTSEQKKDYIEFMNKRTSAFLGGHVPVQIAKTKTDILEAVKTQYAFADAILNGEGDLDDRFKDIENKDYDTIYSEHKDGVKDMFIKSFKEDALKGFAKMYQKGYQGEAKGGLIELLKDELERQVYKDAKEQRERKRKFDDEEEGMPVDTEMDVTMFGGAEVFNNARTKIEDIYKEYRRDLTPNAREFWDEVKDVLSDSVAMGGTDLAVDIAEFDNEVLEHSNVHDLYSRIMAQFFNIKD